MTRSGLWRAAALLLRLLLAGLAVLAAGVLWLLWRSRPAVSGEWTIPGLCHPVSVDRDGWGIPHVFAADERDLFIATGFVQAQDRLWQMEMMRRTAEGRLAEVLGRRAAPTDLLMRTLDVPGAAARAWRALDGVERGELESFALGVNAFLRSEGSRLPLEFRVLGCGAEAWRPLQSLYPYLLSAYLYSHNLNEELFYLRAAGRLESGLAARLLPTAGRPVDPAELEALPEYGRPVSVRAAAWSDPEFPAYGAVAEASNAWVVDGSLSSSGRPVLAADAHSYLSIPSVAYEMGLHGGGREVFGCFAAGSPYAWIGRNAHIAWAAAAVEADLIDLYVERLTPDGSGYVDAGRIVPLERRRIEISLGRDGAPQSHEMRATRHGPLLDELTGPSARNLLYPMVPQESLDGVAMSWVAAKLTDTSARAYSRLNRAANWGEFREALRSLTGLSLHFLYADRDGHIGWQMTGRLPLRSKGGGKYPVPGWTGEYEWTGFLPFEALPSAFDPPGHRIVIANQDVMPSGYPHRVSNSWAGPYRARRIEDLLDAKERHSPADFRRMQLDVYSEVGRQTQWLLLGLASPERRVQRGLELLRSWDGTMRPESPEAALCWGVHEALWEHLFRPLLGEGWVDLRLAGDGHYNALESLLDDPSAPLWSVIEQRSGAPREALLLRAVRDAVVRLERRQGGDPRAWRWDAENELTLVHRPLGAGILGMLFNRGPYGLGGDPNTLNVVRFHPYTRRPRIGAVFRMVVDMAEPDAGTAMGSSGESGYPLNAHYDDMLKAWARGDYHPMPFSPESVRARQESRMSFRP